MCFFFLSFFFLFPLPFVLGNQFSHCRALYLNPFLTKEGGTKQCLWVDNCGIQAYSRLGLKEIFVSNGWKSLICWSQPSWPWGLSHSLGYLDWLSSDQKGHAGLVSMFSVCFYYSSYSHLILWKKNSVFLSSWFSWWIHFEFWIPYLKYLARALFSKHLELLSPTCPFKRQLLGTQYLIYESYKVSASCPFLCICVYCKLHLHMCLSVCIVFKVPKYAYKQRSTHKLKGNKSKCLLVHMT